MNLQLIRKFYRPDGIFSTCQDENGHLVMVTLEHAYGDPVNGFLPKIPPGEWNCVRSKHRLNGMDHDFETFEIIVPGHTNLLFHWGNFNSDSEGCILTGEDIFEGKDQWMVTHSRAEFANFMRLQEGVDNFTLTVQA